MPRTVTEMGWEYTDDLGRRFRVRVTRNAAARSGFPLVQEIIPIEAATDKRRKGRKK